MQARMDNWDRAWAVVLLWFAAVMAIFAFAREWSIVEFGVGFGLVFGSVAWWLRKHVRPAMRKVRLDNFAGFVLLAVTISSAEEMSCLALGNKIANPVLWKDLVIVNGVWLAWFATWYFLLSKKYHFIEKEALMLGASAGVLYEYVSSGAFISNPAGLVLAIPLAVVVYAAIFVLPMQLIDFSGTGEGGIKYIAAPLLPYALSFCVAIPLVLVLS
jgi:hypothetical protein